MPAADEDGFDTVLARLRKVVEDGVGLAQRGHHLLDGAEKRVELLIAGGSQSVPLDEAATDDQP